MNWSRFAAILWRCEDTAPCYEVCQVASGCYFIFLLGLVFGFGTFPLRKLTVGFRRSTCYPHVCCTVPDDLFVCRKRNERTQSTERVQFN
jgi:hypothetical protein